MDRYTFALPGKDADTPGLPGRLKPGRLRIVHLSDWHVTQKLPASYYEMVVAQANAAQPDLIFLTGDFITHHENIARLPGLLAGLRSRYGAYAILGNHDVWAGTEDVIAALTASGVHYIGGGTHMLALPGLPRLVLAGDEMPWNRAGRQEWPKLGPGDIGLGLSHSADQVRRFSRWGAAAVFTGHYHGGQFCLPVVGPIIVPSKYGRRYARGHFVVDDTHLYVSGGVGCAAPPVRIYCPPDFLVVDMAL
jgi:predicted MPP superfamily phosphohydrolase